MIGVDANGRASDGQPVRLPEGTSVAFTSGRLASRVDDGRVRSWPRPFEAGLQEIATCRDRGEEVAVIATGDPMHFGVGGTLARRFGVGAVRCEPVPSAFSLAASRLGWPLEDCSCISLHGAGPSRSVAVLERVVAPGVRFIALNASGETPRAIASWLGERGFGGSRIVVLERMGTNDEGHRDWLAREQAPPDIDDLSVTAVVCVPEPEARWNPALPGLANDAFDHDGQITKAEIRAITLAALRPRPGGVLWDVGAGSGSISVEWLRSSPGGRAFAIEPKAERLKLIRSNAERFGLGELTAVEGSAPLALRDLPRPDAVFVGGGASAPGVLHAAFAALARGGVLVANTVTLEGERALIEAHDRHGGSLRRIAISHAEPIGGFRSWRPAMPVTMLSAGKGS